jgi:hypothetical protein
MALLQSVLVALVGAGVVLPPAVLEAETVVEAVERVLEAEVPSGVSHPDPYHPRPLSSL